jgi:hypothetical protein
MRSHRDRRAAAAEQSDHKATSKRDEDCRKRIALYLPLNLGHRSRRAALGKMNRVATTQEVAHASIPQ